MKILLVVSDTGCHSTDGGVCNIDGEIIAAFDETRAKKAKTVAELTGGVVLDTGMTLNSFPIPRLPMGAKAFYVVVLKKSGDLDAIRTEPLLLRNGELKIPRWYVDSYATQVKLFGKSGERRAYWRLIVELYADSEETAKQIAEGVRKDVLAKARGDGGEL